MNRKKTTASRQHLPGAGPQMRGGRTEVIPFLVLPLLYLVGAMYPGYPTWGFNYWGMFSIPISVTVLLAAFLLMIPAVSERLYDLFGHLAAAPDRVLRRWNRALLIGLISCLLLFLFLLWRSRSLIYGDGFLILDFLSSPDLVDVSDKNHLQLGSILFFRFLLPLLSTAFHISPQNIMAAINAVGGVVGIWALYAIARQLTDSPVRRWFLFCAMMTCAAVVLFFGYIENYTWSTALGLWTLYFSLRYMQQRRHLLWLVVCALATLLCHAVTMPFVLAAAMAIILARRPDGSLPFHFSYRWLWLVMVAGSIGFVATLDMMGLDHPFVPTWPTADNPYWFLSGAHLLDMFNLLLMVAPLGVALTVYRLMMRRRGQGATDPAENVLAMAALASLLVVFWIDPELGAPRDWDLLSLVGFPLTIWAAYHFSGGARFENRGKALVVPVCLIAALNVGPNLYEKNHPDRAVTRLDALSWQSAQYQTTYNKAFRCMSWGMTLSGGMARDDLAKKYFVRRLQADPGAANGWLGLGIVYRNTGLVDSAAVCFERAVKCGATDAISLRELARAKSKQGRFNEALEYADRAELADSNDATIQTIIGNILYNLERFPEALYHSQRAAALNPGSANELCNLGTAWYTVGQYDSAYYYLMRTYEQNPKLPALYEPLILSQLMLGRDSEAEQTLKRYREIIPAAPGLDYYRTRLSLAPQK